MHIIYTFDVLFYLLMQLDAVIWLIINQIDSLFYTLYTSVLTLNGLLFDI